MEISTHKLNRCKNKHKPGQAKPTGIKVPTTFLRTHKTQTHLYTAYMAHTCYGGTRRIGTHPRACVRMRVSPSHRTI